MIQGHCNIVVITPCFAVTHKVKKGCVLMQAFPKRLRTPGTGCFMRVRVFFWPCQRVHRTQFLSVDLPLLTRCAILAALPRSDVMGRRQFLARRFRLDGLVLSYRSASQVSGSSCSPGLLVALLFPLRRMAS